MEEELRARVEERERRAAEEIEADTQDAEAQWQNRIPNGQAICTRGSRATSRYVGPRRTSCWEYWDTTEGDLIQRPEKTEDVRQVTLPRPSSRYGPSFLS